MVIIGIMYKLASVAQSVVHLTRNEKVACSSQVTSSKKTLVLSNKSFLVIFALASYIASQ